MEEIKVESGVPIPSARRSDWDKIVAEMGPGDCVTVSKGQASSVANRIKKAGGKAITRTLEDGSVRVWRSE